VPSILPGHMRLISKVNEEISNIGLYEYDNKNCKYKSAITGAINQK